MNKLIILSLLVTLTSVFASPCGNYQSQASDDTIKRDAQEIQQRIAAEEILKRETQECKSELGYDTPEYELKLANYKYNASQVLEPDFAACLIECIIKKQGMIKNNTLDHDGFMASAKLHYGHRGLRLTEMEYYFSACQIEVDKTANETCGFGVGYRNCLMNVEKPRNKKFTADPRKLTEDSAVKCKNMLNISDVDFKIIGPALNAMPINEAQSCLVECVFTDMGLIKDGKLNLQGIIAFTAMIDIDLKEAEVLFQKCHPEVDRVNTKCGASTAIMSCFKKHFHSPTLEE